MFSAITPEQAGISSAYVKQFIETLDRRGLVTHSVLLMRGNSIFAEYYWHPYTKDSLQRMYSQTKSFVSVAIGLLEEDGLLSLDDRIADHFPEKLDGELPPYQKELTVRQMLTMSTSGKTARWFTDTDPDRTHLYFNKTSATVPTGMRYRYDSAGSQVLSSLVEKLSGKSLFAFLNERIFRHLGTFKNATVLKTPNGDSWGDSAMVCTTRDMASFARFVMNYGTWNGVRLMNEAYLKTATSPVVDNQITSFEHYYTQGYGYQIWRLPENGFSFRGMGCQFTVCLPDKDLVFVITGDDQGLEGASDLILSAFYEIIVDHLENSPLPEDPEAEKALLALGKTLKIPALRGIPSPEFQKDLSGRTYTCEENPTGITRFSFVFSENGEGEFRYTNAQGNKVLPFGLNKNVFCKFPQFGYPNEKGRVPTEDGFRYDCACAAAWREEKKLLLRVQIIDRYLGNLFAVFSFRDDVATVTLWKKAEAFLEEYQGEFVAHKE